MPHVVLLGDSIFDNAAYVPDRPPVIEQLRRALPAGWGATLCAVDGAVTDGVARQLAGRPAAATHLVVSVGGNDALYHQGVLDEPAATVGEALEIIDGVREEFRRQYAAMLAAVLGAGLPAAVCTVYDRVPGLNGAQRAALAGFNEVILREAFARGLPVVDLRLVCQDAGDYSPLSPIEPSVAGGAKIALAIAELVTRHDFAAGRAAVYW